MAASDVSNPGSVLASAVDMEVAKFRELEENLQKLRNDYQVLLSQMTENEMVFNELKLLRPDSDEDGVVLYKMLGPILIQQSLEDAKQTVSKRLEFIQQEKTKIEKKLELTEKDATDLATKIRHMQNALQETTVRAVQAITEQHNRN